MNLRKRQGAGHSALDREVKTPESDDEDEESVTKEDQDKLSDESENCQPMRKRKRTQRKMASKTEELSQKADTKRKQKAVVNTNEFAREFAETFPRGVKWQKNNLGLVKAMKVAFEFFAFRKSRPFLREAPSFGHFFRGVAVDQLYPGLLTLTESSTCAIDETDFIDCYSGRQNFSECHQSSMLNHIDLVSASKNIKAFWDANFKLIKSEHDTRVLMGSLFCGLPRLAKLLEETPDLDWNRWAFAIVCEELNRNCRVSSKTILLISGEIGCDFGVTQTRLTKNDDGIWNSIDFDSNDVSQFHDLFAALCLNTECKSMRELFRPNENLVKTYLEMRKKFGGSSLEMKDKQLCSDYDERLQVHEQERTNKKKKPRADNQAPVKVKKQEVQKGSYVQEKQVINQERLIAEEEEEEKLQGGGNADFVALMQEAMIVGPKEPQRMAEEVEMESQEVVDSHNAVVALTNQTGLTTGEGEENLVDQQLISLVEDLPIEGAACRDFEAERQEELLDYKTMRKHSQICQQMPDEETEQFDQLAMEVVNILMEERKELIEKINRLEEEWEAATVVNRLYVKLEEYSGQAQRFTPEDILKLDEETQGLREKIEEVNRKLEEATIKKSSYHVSDDTAQNLSQQRLESEGLEGNTSFTPEHDCNDCLDQLNRKPQRKAISLVEDLPIEGVARRDFEAERQEELLNYETMKKHSQICWRMLDEKTEDIDQSTMEFVNILLEGNNELIERISRLEEELNRKREEAT